MRCSPSTVRRKCSSSASVGSTRPASPTVRTFGRVPSECRDSHRIPSRPRPRRRMSVPGATRITYTPERLLAVAVEVFNLRGYDGTSMEDLARATGITKSSIYHHVRSKEELLRLAVSRALDRIFAVLDQPAARTGRAIDRLEHVVRASARVLVDELPYVTLLLRVRGNTATEQWALQRRREFDR